MNLSVENVSDVLALADLHCAEQLRTHAIDFINRFSIHRNRTPAPNPVFTPPPLPPLGHIRDVMLVWRKGNIDKTVSVLQYCVLL